MCDFLMYNLTRSDSLYVLHTMKYEGFIVVYRLKRDWRNQLKSLACLNVCIYFLKRALSYTSNSMLFH